MGSFFKRIRCDRIIFRPKIFRFLLVCWSPILVISLIGYLNFGSEFFSTAHWLSDSNTKFNPILNITIMFIFLISIGYLSLDIILSKPCYVGIRDDKLVLLRRKIYDLRDIDTKNITIEGNWNNILLVPLLNNSKSISIPLIKSHISGSVAVTALSNAITENLRLSE